MYLHCQYGFGKRGISVLQIISMIYEAETEAERLFIK